MPATEISKKYRDLLQKCLAGNQEAFKQIRLDLTTSGKTLSKQDIVEFLFNREDFLRDLHQLSDDFKLELLSWYQRNEIDLSSRPLRLVFRMLQASKDAKPNDQWIFTIDEDVLSGVGKKDRARVYNFRGSLFYYRKNYADALADYAVAIKLESSDASWYGNRGVVFHAMGNYDAAIRELKNAIILEPFCANYYVYLASAYFEKREYSAAITHYTNAINLEPNEAINFENRAQVYRHLKDYLSAKSNYEIAIQCLVAKLNDNKLPGFSQTAIKNHIDEIKQKIVDCDARLPKKRVDPMDALIQEMHRANAELNASLKRMVLEYRQTAVQMNSPAAVSPLPSIPPLVPAAAHRVSPRRVDPPAIASPPLPSIPSVPVAVPKVSSRHMDSSTVVPPPSILALASRSTLCATRATEPVVEKIKNPSRELVIPMEKNRGSQCRII